jgi:Transcriptional regulator
MDRLTSMAVFVKAVETGSFAAAAAALGISAPMVGKHVQFLEARLGARLLNRTTRRQALTDLGQDYYDRCRAVLAEAEAADALAEDSGGAIRGRLRVSAPAHFGRHCVAPVLLGLAHAHPGLRLDFLFADRFIDLADASNLMARRLASQAMVVCAAPAYLAARGRPALRADLAGHEAIVYRRSGRVPPWLFPGADGAIEAFVPGAPAAPR